MASTLGESLGRVVFPFILRVATKDKGCFGVSLSSDSTLDRVATFFVVQGSLYVLEVTRATDAARETTSPVTENGDAPFTTIATRTMGDTVATGGMVK